jgi:beta-RFAP synthase
LFGGIGVMIDSPALSVVVEPANEFAIGGSLAQRTQWFFDRWRQWANENEFDINQSADSKIAVEQADQHLGLGTGTRLGLAVATALNEFHGIANYDLIELAHALGRGNRSAVGIHGFLRGGFIFDEGKQDAQSIGKLGIHKKMPEAWRVVVGLASDQTGFSGESEADVFDQVAQQSAGKYKPGGNDTDLRKFVCQNVLPALAEEDFAAFSAAIFEYGFQSGLIFAEHQGGPYNGEQMTEIIAWLRANGVTGVGQSSWGPAFYALAESAESALQIRDSIVEEFGITGCWVSSFARTGAAVTTIDNKSEPQIQPNT